VGLGVGDEVSVGVNDGLGVGLGVSVGLGDGLGVFDGVGVGPSTKIHTSSSIVPIIHSPPTS
jgi:hypothetical protein